MTLAEPSDLGRDSRLTVQGPVTFAGPNDETYSLTPISGFYYNDWWLDESVSPGEGPLPEEPGFVNLAGALDVEFFVNMPVHLHSFGERGTNAAKMIYLMGGWPDKGWEISGQNYITTPTFDTKNRGFPHPARYEFPTFDVNFYREGHSESEFFLCRAVQSLFNVVPLDYTR